MDKYIGAKLIQAEPERNPVTKEITGYKVCYAGSSTGRPQPFSFM